MEMKIYLRIGWSGHKWDEYSFDYFSVIDRDGFDSLRVEIWFKMDQTVNYRADINGLHCIPWMMLFVDIRSYLH